MAIVNWKFPLIEGPQEDRGTPEQDKILWIPLWMPWKYRSLTFGVQANTACLWAEVDPKAKERWFRIAAISTGVALPDGIDLGAKLGQCALTIAGRIVPAPTENSVKHFYVANETAEEAAAMLALPKLGPKAGQVIPFPLMFAAAVGSA